MVFAGTYDEILQSETSDTGKYISGKKHVELPKRNRKPTGFIEVRNAYENNLRHVDADIPTGVLAVVTGVSGSGKSSLVMDILANYLINKLNGANHQVGKVGSIKGLEKLDKAIIVDQSAIGKTPHSNIATYTGVFTYIREAFAMSQEAQRRGYDVGRFSFNTR